MAGAHRAAAGNDPMTPRILHHVRISGGTAARDGIPFPSASGAPAAAPEDLYTALGCAYPKFFKMDLLCKWAWVAAEYLLTENGMPVYAGIPGEKIAVVLFTGSGCLEADKKYYDTLNTVPSPSLFVYTLSNIMLGEICIRHGFKGEQLCMAAEGFDSGELLFWAEDLLRHKGMDACLCGWVDVTGMAPDIDIRWMTR